MQAEVCKLGKVHLIPENIYTNIINRMAREATFKEPSEVSADGASNEPGHSGPDFGWSGFFQLVLPWKGDHDGEETLTLTKPLVRFLADREKTPEELTRISHRCVAEKMVGFIKNGKDNRTCLVTFCLEFREFLLLFSAASDEEFQPRAFHPWWSQCMDVSTSILAIAGAGKPGWVWQECFISFCFVTIYNCKL